MISRARRVLPHWAKMIFTSAGLRGISGDTVAVVQDKDKDKDKDKAPDSSVPYAMLPGVSSAALETGLTPMTPQEISAPRNTTLIIMRMVRPRLRLISECITVKVTKKSRRFMANPNR